MSDYIMTADELIEKCLYYLDQPNYYDNKTWDWMTWNGQAWNGDCIRTPKALLYWGWKGDKNTSHGGAVYDSKYDFTSELSGKGWIAHCNNVSDNFNWMKVGELLAMEGHYGIYLGNWTVFEVTVAWGANGAVLSHIDNTGRRTLDGVPAQNAYWKLHGEIPEVDYTVKEEDDFPMNKPEVSPFSDVSPDDPKYKHIKALYDMGIVNGYSDGTFRPKEPITREDMCIIANKIVNPEYRTKR